MSKNFEMKKEVVANISEKLNQAQGIVVVHYSGLTVEEVTNLRSQCRAAGVEYLVLKNTLVRRALDDRQITGLDHTLEGPNAFAFSMKDPISAAKVVCDFIDKTKTEHIAVKGGLMGNEVLDEKGVKALASMPSREVLLARLVGSLNSSISKFVYCLEAIRKQKAGE